MSRVLLIHGLLLVYNVLYTTSSDVSWLKNSLIYQIYPRSFLDLDSDGIGDLKGIMKKIDYIASLGVTAIWLAPIYPSQNMDFGYDVTSFRDINPEYGTLRHFVDLVNTFKAKGIKVLLDFVPNHSSTQHFWFINSENKNDTLDNYSEYYVWKNANGYDSNNNPIPPNNWLSVFNTGSAWKWSQKRKQFYLHNFLEQQADFNYNNPSVYKRMEETLNFWMSHGVDGFRIDSLSWIFEDQQYKDEPQSENYNPLDQNNYENLQHIYTIDQPKDVEFVKRVRSIIDQFTKTNNDNKRILLLESDSPLEKLLPYYGDSISPGAVPLNYLLFHLRPDDNSSVWETSIKKYYETIGDREPTWMIGNHNWKRVASRWPEGWVDLFHIIMMTLKGTAVTYYGEEIGLVDNILRYDQLKDVRGIIAGPTKYTTRSRDFQRAPMPWDDSHLGGFSKAPSSWIPLTPSYWKLNVKSQETSKKSHLKVYRKLARLRKQESMISGDCEVKGTDDGVFYVIRALSGHPTYISAVNMGDNAVNANLQSIRSNLPDRLKIILSSVNYPEPNSSILNSNNVFLPPKTGLVLAT